MEVLKNIRSKCGSSFLVFLKLSASNELLADDFFKHLDVSAIEISYGMMSDALNIFRGEIPIKRILQYNPFISNLSKWKKYLWKKLFLPLIRKRQILFSEDYNRKFAKQIRKQTQIPLILVGGIRSLDSMEAILQSKDVDAISLCRPLICEPDLIKKFKTQKSKRSKCINCNSCAIMCDTNYSIQCYRRK